MVEALGDKASCYGDCGDNSVAVSLWIIQQSLCIDENADHASFCAYVISFYPRHSGFHFYTSALRREE